MPELHDDPQENLNLRKQWDLLCRRRWWLALPAFGIWTVVWAVAWFLPALYRSETVILVEQQKVPEQYVVSNVASDLQERLQSMTQQILSRTRLLKIMDEFELYPKLRARLTQDELVDQMRKDIQIDLVQAPTNARELTAFKIAYLSADPRVAQRVTEELTSLFIAENLKARQEQSEQTTQFLDSQLEEARTNLADQEGRLREFKSRYLGELPEQVQSNVQILAGLQARLQQETDALSQAKQQGVYLESLLNQWRSLESDISAGRSGNAQTPPALDQELASLRGQLADLSSHYTEKHPDIRKLKEQIARTERLKQQMEAQMTAGKAAAEASDGELHPSNYADLQAMSPRLQLESQLKANRLEIQTRQRNIEDLKRQNDQYQSRLNLTPVREQQLAGLSRDYEQSRKNYEGLLAKRDQSEMATNLEKRQGGEQFRVLDPPNLPQKPYSPNRLKLSLIGLVAGILTGLSLTAGAEAADDRIYSQDDVTRIIAAPLLVEIPPLLTRHEEREGQRRLWMERLIMSAMVVMTSAGFLATYIFG